MTLDADVAAPARRRSTSTSRSRRPTARRSPCSGRTARARRTLLRALAGLAAARPRVASRSTASWSTTRRPTRYVVPERRSVGVVFQDYLLFPHLTRARERRVRAAQPRDVARRGARRRADEWLERVGSRRPRATPSRARSRAGRRSASRWRARSCTEPRLLLLDEPLAALDVGTRTELRRDLRPHLATFPGARVLVTHELLDAVALADRLVVLEHGRVAQAGTVAEVVGAAALAVRRRPRRRQPAPRARPRARGRRSTTGGSGRHRRPGRGRRVRRDPPARGERCTVQHPEGSPRNVWRGRDRTAPTCSATGCASTSPARSRSSPR